jgi:MFS family permease
VTTVFTYGYDAIIIGGTLDVPAFIKEVAHAKALTPTQTSIIVAVTNGGAIIGTFIVGFAGDRFGRKKILLLGAVINLIGAVFQTAATNIALLTVGRFIGSRS